MINKNESIWDKDLLELGKIKKKNLIYGGNVRMQLGLFYTDEEYERKRKKLLKKKLP